MCIVEENVFGCVCYIFEGYQEDNFEKLLTRYCVNNIIKQRN